MLWELCQLMDPSCDKFALLSEYEGSRINSPSERYSTSHTTPSIALGAATRVGPYRTIVPSRAAATSHNQRTAYRTNVAPYNHNPYQRHAAGSVTHSHDHYLRFGANSGALAVGYDQHRIYGAKQSAIDSHDEEYQICPGCRWVTPLPSESYWQPSAFGCATWCPYALAV
jgi:hypothetical protein